MASLTAMALCVTVPGPCDPEDLIDGIIFAANYLGSTQLLSDKTPSKNVRMMQAQEAVSRIKVRGGACSSGGRQRWAPELSVVVTPAPHVSSPQFRGDWTEMVLQSMLIHILAV